MLVKLARLRAKCIVVSSQVCEDQLLGEGVLGLGHLFVIQKLSFAHLPVDTRQNAQDIIVPCATKEKTIILHNNLRPERQRGAANVALPFC